MGRLFLPIAVHSAVDSLRVLLLYSELFVMALARVQKSERSFTHTYLKNGTANIATRMVIGHATLGAI